MDFQFLTVDVSKAENYLTEFVREFERLYGVRNMTLNVHLIQHLPENVRNLGPLFVTACYSLEDLNGKLGNLAHGTKDAAMQIAKRIHFFTGLPTIIKDMPPGEARDFCEMLTIRGKRFHVSEKKSSNFLVVGYYGTPQNGIISLLYNFFYHSL